ncbi:hypothetical protein [Acinetobacter seifertii]|uniref:hypothetical protein n=1 Tax=Acinetobacter seifertii TaxID=1530123 RepID=UPI001CCE42CA|nr:hypothetical protein [Acinetobacter seifertii]MBZ6534885.1 hypothetical protein [Acinetobacter seifertii]
MYELTVKEIYGSKIWSHDLGENFPQVPDSFSVGRLNLMVCAMFFPPTPLKNFLINVVETSSAWEFYFEVKKVPQETPHQTVAIFKGMDVIPESGRELVLHMVTGQFLAPAVYKKDCGHFHTPGGEARPYMIKEWAYQDELNNALGLTAVDAEKLKELNKRADNDKGQTPFNSGKIADLFAEALAEIFPEAKVHVRKS